MIEKCGCAENLRAISPRACLSHHPLPSAACKTPHAEVPLPQTRNYCSYEQMNDMVAHVSGWGNCQGRQFHVDVVFNRDTVLRTDCQILDDKKFPCANLKREPQSVVIADQPGDKVQRLLLSMLSSMKTNYLQKGEKSCSPAKRAHRNSRCRSVRAALAGKASFMVSTLHVIIPPRAEDTCGSPHCPPP